MPRLLFLALLFALGVVGCAPGREARADLPAPPLAEARAGAAPATATAAPARAEGPLTLERAIALALARNPELDAADRRVAEARARVTEATSAFFPEITARLSYARTDNPLQAFGFIVAQRRFSPSFDVNDPGPTQEWRPEVTGGISLFRGFQDLERRRAAVLGVEAAALAREAAQNEIAAAVTAAYYAVLAAREMTDVARASIEVVSKEIEAARARVEAGTALRSDVLSLEVRRAAAREAEVRARSAVESAKAGLRALLAVADDEPLEVASVAGGIPEAPPTYEQARERARAERPEIAAARRLTAIRAREAAAERGAWLPRVSAFGAYGQDAPDLALSSDADNWSFGASVELDIFSGFRTTARIAEADARLALARAAERQAVLDVERDVRTAWLAREEAAERVRVAEAALVAADEALRLVTEQYGAGTVTVTRYLEAEVARTDARSRAVAARFDARRADAALARAIGFWR
jgi:outer membrane protein TolC